MSAKTGRIDLDSLFLPSGYLDMKKIMALPYSFIIIAGGRGIGKTYGALAEVKEHPEWNTLYLRSMQKEHEMIRKPKYSPFAWHNKDFGWNVQPFKEDKVASIWCDAVLNEEKGIYEPASEPYMTSMALYDIASIRGFNGADIQWIIYDEFNPQKGMIFRINDDDFPNCYETVNRNRELQGEPAVKCLLLSNSNNIDNPIYRGYGLVNKVERMKREGQYISAMPNRGMLLIVLPETEIGKLKRNTALYKATSGTKFASMALDNEFTNDTPSQVKSLNLKGMIALAKTDEFTIYQMQDKSRFYVTEFTKPKAKETFTRSHADLTRFRKDYNYVWQAYVAKDVVFESYGAEIKFKKYFIDNVKNL